MNRVRTTVLVVVGMLVTALAVAGPATAKDRNRDRLPDRWEKRHHLSLRVDQAKRDQDRDGLNNRGEFRSHSNPRRDDTDHDGIEDGDENAGVIGAFDGETLTVDLFGGGSVTATVDEDTEVECEDERHDGGDDPVEEGTARHDNSGPGSESSGPGHDGDEGDEGEQGDDEDACSVEDLTVGATVHEAEVELADGSARFEEIELVG